MLQHENTSKSCDTLISFCTANMANTTFEGDLEGLNSDQIEFIGAVLNEKGFNEAKVTITPIGEAGDNYVSKVKRIVAEKNGEEFKMVAKFAPTLDHVRNSINAQPMFHNEFMMYTEVLPKFTELEKAAGIPEAQRLRYAACYGCLMEEPYELVLLEDLQVPGFEMLDRFQSLSDKEVKLVLKSFAKLHSLSFALKYKQPETFDDVKGKLINIYVRFNDKALAKKYFASIENETLALIDTQKSKDAVKGTLSKITELSIDVAKVDTNSRFGVIAKGDAWTNNIMFTLKEGKAVACCMIDYQASRVGSPAGDLHYMLINCTDYDTRSKHFCNWIEYYHTELDKNLSQFGLKGDYVYPRDQLEADLKRHGKLSLASAIFVATIMTRQRADAAAFKEKMQKSYDDMVKIIDDMQMTRMDDGTTSLFKARVEGAVKTLSELGYL